MANTNFNTTGTFITASMSVSGAFSGFTVVSGSAIFTALLDYNRTQLSTSSISNWVLPAGTTINMYVTSASISQGGVVFYPLSIITPQL